MPLQVRIEGDVAILSNVGRSMNDPRYPDAGKEVAALLDEGLTRFIGELRGVGEVGPPLLGLLMTITRLIRGRGGELVLAGVGRTLERYLEEMMMEEYWEMFRDVHEARTHFARGGRGDD